MRIHKGETLLEPEDLSFPFAMYLVAGDNSRFQEAHDMLRAFGLIPHNMDKRVRSVKERIKDSLSWREEDCCVLAIPGREHIGEMYIEKDFDSPDFDPKANRWGIYRAVFRDQYESDLPSDLHPHIQFKYFMNDLPEKYLQDLVINENPMRPVAKAVHDLVQPVRVLDFCFDEIPFPYLD